MLGSFVLWFLGTAPLPTLIATGFLSYAPLLFGFWIGFRRSGSPWSIFALNSTFVGGLAAATVYAAELVSPDGQPEQVFTAVGFLYLIVEGFAGPFLLFFSGTLLGTFVQRQILRPYPARANEGDPGSDDVSPNRADRMPAYIAAFGVVIAAVIQKLPEIITAITGNGN